MQSTLFISRTQLGLRKNWDIWEFEISRKVYLKYKWLLRLLPNHFDIFKIFWKFSCNYSLFELQPKFLTKEERAAEALKRRQEAVEEQRRKQEEEKKKQLEYLNQGREGEDHISLYCIVCKGWGPYLFVLSECTLLCIQAEKVRSLSHC